MLETNLVLFVVFVLSGFIAGISSGMLGIGGGVIFIPVLFYFLPLAGVSENSLVLTVISTSLFAGSFSATGALLNHLRKNNIEIKTGLLFSCGSLIASIIIPRIIVGIDPGILRYIIFIILVIVLIRFLFDSGRHSGIKNKLNKIFLFPFGLIVGALSATTGLGGGVLTLPILNFLYSIPVKLAVGTSSLVVAVTLICSTISFAFLQQNNAGGINYQVGLLLGISALVGSYFGVKLVFNFSQLVIKRIFSIFLLIAITKLLFDL